ncbi:hypothetical protein PR202_gb03979 [Eleusine coracana subsp. coracana]|uniref:Uncharacterized protein n=1 Tax=Eleusine coracana subsp. coracana TaxID=191504 RepID=A0AAV5E3D7_ELECO|nr:hypothetical protein PR202_gb03979 [Eleusine coracana subsp. coracana]
MATSAAAALSCSCRPSSPSSSSAPPFRRRNIPSVSVSLSLRHRRCPRLAPLNVVDDSKEVEAGAGASAKRSRMDELVDGMDFGELCNEFECISSPYVEATARQIARDIIELREDNRAFNCYAVSVKYKTVQEMSMQSTSTLTIKWAFRGKPKNPFFAAVGGDVMVRVDSRFVLNQISGQVLEQVDSWDLSASSLPAQAFFWLSRRVYSTVESGKDTIEAVKSTASGLSSKKDQDIEAYPDPSGDPTKFFQRPDDGLSQDVYQIALLLAMIYFVVQFLKTTL